MEVIRGTVLTSGTERLMLTYLPCVEVSLIAEHVIRASPCAPRSSRVLVVTCRLSQVCKVILGTGHDMVVYHGV